MAEQTKETQDRDQEGKADQAKRKRRREYGETSRKRRVQKAQRGAEHEDAVARLTSAGLHIVEDIIYALTAFVLVGGAFLVLGHSIVSGVKHFDEGVTKAMEAVMDSLLIVFILVELLSAVRTAIDEHFLVAEPFLLVGILAAIKEMVVLATFRIESEPPRDVALKIAVLGAVVIAMALATWILRRREREPKESGDSDTPDEA